MPNTVRVGVGVTGAKGAASEVDRLRDKFDKLQKTSAKGFVTGLGAGAAIAGINALSGALQGGIRWLEDSVAAYRENEVSVAQLGASLRANVPEWQKYTAEIEKAVTAGQKLGFDDEEQRAGLTKLVGAYGNVTKALQMHALAMDLARYSGMGLLEAEDLLVKVHAGSFRALKSLGISTKGVTTETEALGKIFDKVGGQAAAYAQTDLGKVDAANIKLEESQERIGKNLSKLGTEVLPIVADATDSFVTGLGTIGDVLSHKTSPEVLALYNLLGLLSDEDLRAALAAEEHRKALIYMADATKDDLIPALDDAGDSTDELKAKQDKLKDSLDKVTEAVGRVDHAWDLFTGAEFDAAKAAGDAEQAHQDLIKLLDEEPINRKSAEWVIWNGKVADARQTLFDLQYQMKQTEGPAALELWLIRVRDGLAKTDVKGRALLDTLINLNAAMKGAAYMAGASKDDKYVPPKPAPSGAVGGAGRHSYAAGTSYVPHDMTANLHRGEAVIPAAENRRGGTTIINISGADVSSPERIRDVIRRGQFIVNGTPWATGGPWA